MNAAGFRHQEPGAHQPGGRIAGGQPVWLLVAVIAGWIAMRVVAWQAPQQAMPAPVPLSGPAPVSRMTDPASPRPSAATEARAGLPPEVANQFAGELPREFAHALAVETARAMARQIAPVLAIRLLHERGLQQVVPPGSNGKVSRPGPATRERAFATASGRESAAPAAPESDIQAFRLAPGRKAPSPAASEATPAPAGHRSLLSMLPELLLHPGRARQTGLAIDPGPRFSADAWLLRRGGGVGAVPFAAGTAGYGGSQSGAVLRYRLFSNDRRQTAVFLRAASALNLPEREATLGVQFRPLPNVPIALLAEGRLTNDGTGNRLRPAIQAVSQFPPVSLPLGMRGELYAAGGYVGGRGATPFYEVAGVADRKLIGVGKASELRIGAGVWAGGQKGVGRVDVGPRASVGFRVKRIGLRAAVDYRARVAGSAAPGSGPALTLSAGF